MLFIMESRGLFSELFQLSAGVLNFLHTANLLVTSECLLLCQSTIYEVADDAEIVSKGINENRFFKLPKK